MAAQKKPTHVMFRAINSQEIILEGTKTKTGELLRFCLTDEEKLRTRPPKVVKNKDGEEAGKIVLNPIARIPIEDVDIIEALRNSRDNAANKQGPGSVYFFLEIDKAKDLKKSFNNKKAQNDALALLQKLEKNPYLLSRVAFLCGCKSSNEMDQYNAIDEFIKHDFELFNDLFSDAKKLNLKVEKELEAMVLSGIYVTQIIKQVNGSYQFEGRRIGTRPGTIAIKLLDDALTAEQIRDAEYRALEKLGIKVPKTEVKESSKAEDKAGDKTDSKTGDKTDSKIGDKADPKAGEKK